VRYEVTVEPDRGTELVDVTWRLGSRQLPTHSTKAPLASDLLGDQRLDDAAARTAAEVGRAVFRVLAPETTREHVLNHLEETLGSGCGVRIVLRCPRPLDRVPWELMWCRAHGHLALVDGISIVRHSRSSPPDIDPVAERRPLQVLHVDTSRQRSEIPRSLVVHDPDIQDGLRWKDVRQGLRTTAATTFHFTGQGTPPFGSREASLRFTGRTGTDDVTCSSLIDGLAGTDVVLAVLAARYPGVDGYRDDIGAELVAAGVPAALSMHPRRDDPAGDVLIAQVYPRLALGASLDEAVAAGRRAMHDAGSSDWWLPVVHTCALNGIRFAPTQVLVGTRRRPSTVLPRTRLAVPRQGDPSYLWTPAPLPCRAVDSVVLSANGRACAVAATDGKITVGIVGYSGAVRWWHPFSTQPGTVVIAVQSYPYCAEVLVSSPDGTHRIQVTVGGRDHVPKQSWEHAAVSGAWVGRTFAWIDATGTARQDDERAPTPIRNGCRLVDAAVCGEQQLVSWVRGQELGMCRTNLASSSSSEIRTITLDVVPEELIIARCATGVPLTAFLAVGKDLISWTWDDLIPTSSSPDRDVTHGS